MKQQEPLHFGFLLGSARESNNNRGISLWVQQHLQRLAPDAKISIFEPFTSPLPLGQFTGSYMAMALDGKSDPHGYTLFPYSTEKEIEWSRIVQDFDATIVVTPEYNWGIPSTIKECLDHLYSEWVKMPFMAVNYGAQLGGGKKCAYALKQVIDDLMAIPISVEKVMIKLPPSHVSGSARTTPDEEFLKEYEATLDVELSKLLAAALGRQKTKRGDVLGAKRIVAEIKAQRCAAPVNAAKTD